MEFLKLLEGVRTPFFDAVFQFITLFGEETLFMVAAMILFWCVSKRYGYYLLYVCFFGTVVNQFLKLLFCVPRPWVRDPDFTIVESAREAATGYSFPSGHTQCAGGLFLGLARLRKERNVRIACVALFLLVGFSRMYLGVHTPADVGVSALVAAALVFAVYPAFQNMWEHAARGNAHGAWLYGLLIAVAAALVFYAECCPQPAAAVAENTKNGVSTAYKMLGASVGLVLVQWLDRKVLRFETKAVWWAQAVKVVIGLGLVMAVRLLTKAPLLSLTGGHPSADGVRYLAMVLTGGALWPASFRWFARLGRK